MMKKDKPRLMRKSEPLCYRGVEGGPWRPAAQGPSGPAGPAENRIMIYGPKNDGTYIVEFKTADGEALAISVPRGETRVLTALGEEQESGCAGPEARRGGRLGQMSRRKSEITGHMNERDFPHLVELELPSGGFRNKSQELEAFHRERGIVIRRGCGRNEGDRFHVRFCFPDATTADTFQERFGGRRLSYSPSRPGRPFGPRLRHQRSI
jgi:hypothetical protein